MELERLEVVFDGDLSPFEQKLEAMQSKLDNIMGRLKQTSSKSVDSVEKDFNNTQGFDKFTKQMERLNSNFEKQMSKMQQTASKQSTALGNSISSGVTKSTAKMSQDVQAQVDKINLKMQQAKAAQQKMANLQSDRNGASISGDGKATSKYDDQIAKTQIQMNKAQADAQAMVRKLKSEYDAIPNSLNVISGKMEANERQIESMRAKVKALNAEMKSQQIEKGSFSSGKWQSTGVEDTPKSSKTAESMTKLSAKMQKLISENDALQQAYARTEDRSESLRKALSSVNTQLGEQPVKARMASNGMKNLSNNTKKTEGLFSRFKNVVNNSVGRLGNIFNRQSKQVTSGTNRMSQGMGGFGRSMKMLWSQLFLFTFLYQGIMTLAGGLSKALQTNAQFSASLNQIKVNLLTAFYPIYQTVLPAINALMSSLAKVTGYLASFIATLFGMNVSDAFGGAQGLMNDVQALGDTSSGTADGYDEMAQSIKDSNAQMKQQQSASEKARKAASKLKQMLMGFDEINTLDFDDGSDDFEPEAFTPMEVPKNPGASTPPWADFMNANIPDTPKWLTDFAGKFKDVMSKLFDPIKKAWDAQGKNVMDAWKRALDEVTKLVQSIGKSFMEVWTNGTGQQFVENLLILLADVLNIIGDIAQAFRIAWDENGRGTALIQQIFNALNQWLSVLHDIAQSFRDVWNNGTGVEVATAILDLFTHIFHLIETIGIAFQNAWNDEGRGTALIQSIADMFVEIIRLIDSITLSFDAAFASGIGESILGNIFEIITNIFNIVGNLAQSFREAWDENGRGQAIFEGILGIIDTVLEKINGMTAATAEWAAELDFRPLLDSIKVLLDAIQPLTENIGSGLEWFYTNVLLPLAGYAIEDLIPAFLNALSTAIDTLNIIIEALKPLFEWLWENMLKPIAEWTGGIIVEVLDGISSALEKIGESIENDSEGFSTFVTLVGSFGAALLIVNGAVAAWNIVSALATTATTALGMAFSFLTGPIGLVVLAITAVIAIGVTLWKNWDTIKEKASELGGWISEKWEGIKTATSEAWDNVKNWTSEKWNAAKDAVTSKASEIYTTAKNKFTDVANTVKEKAGNAKDWASEKFNGMKDTFVEVNKVMAKKTAEKFIEISNTIKEKAGTAKNNAVSAFSDLKSGVSDRLNEVKDTASDVFGKIGNWAKELPGKIGDGLRNGVTAIGNAIKGIANTMVKPIGRAVNGIIGGINWVLGAVNISPISKWEVPSYAQGTGYHPGGPALVNDASGSQYQEMFSLPDGRMGMFPKQRNLLVDLPKGAQVLPGNMVPNYAGGIFSTFKDFFTNGWDRTKEIAGDVWNIISNPSALIEEAMNKFVNFTGMLDPGLSIVKGALSYVKDGLHDKVVGWINEFTGFSDGGLISKHGLFEGAEGDNAEMIIPLTKPARALELINDSLDFMGMDGVPELTMPEVFNSAEPASTGSLGGRSKTGSESYKGADLSEIGNQMASNIGNTVTEAILQLVNTLMSNNNMGMDSDTSLEVVLQVDSTRLGEVSVKGINKYHKKTGQVELIL